MGFEEIILFMFRGLLGFSVMVLMVLLFAAKSPKLSISKVLL